MGRRRAIRQSYLPGIAFEIPDDTQYLAFCELSECASFVKPPLSRTFPLNLSLASCLLSICEQWGLHIDITHVYQRDKYFYHILGSSRSVLQSKFPVVQLILESSLSLARKLLRYFANPRCLCVSVVIQQYSREYVHLKIWSCVPD